MNETLSQFWDERQKKVIGKEGPSSYALEIVSKFPEHAIVCDVGGGIGSDSLYFLSLGDSVSLLDISPFAIEVAKNNVNKAGFEKNFTSFLVDFNTGKFPLGDASVDVVYARLSLHYFQNANTIMLFKECFRILRKRGMAFITLKSPNDGKEMEYLRSTAELVEEGVFKDKNQIMSRFSLKQLSTMLDKAGIPVYKIREYVEGLAQQNDTVKSGNATFLLNEITIRKE